MIKIILDAQGSIYMDYYRYPFQSLSKNWFGFLPDVGM